jgi:hypothetical protein
MEEGSYNCINQPSQASQNSIELLGNLEKLASVESDMWFFLWILFRHRFSFGWQ